MADIINIEITQDGTIKTTTDPISMANHSNAERLLLDMARQTDGQLNRVKNHGHRHGKQKHHRHAGHGHDHSH